MDLELARADRRLDPVAVAAGSRQRLRDGGLRRPEEAQRPCDRARARAPARVAPAAVSSARGQSRCSSRGGPGRTTTTAVVRSRARARARSRRGRARVRPPGASPACARRCANSVYGRPRRSAIIRETAPISRSSTASTTRATPGDPRDELDRAVVVGRAEPTGDEADIGVEPLREARARDPRLDRRRS